MLLRFNFPDRDVTLYRFWWVGGRQKKSTKINFWGPETARWGGGVFHPKGWWPKSSCPASKVCLPWGFRREKSGMSREFCWDVPDPWRCSKSLCKQKVHAHFPSFVFLGGFEGRNLGCLGNFAGTSRTPGGVQKVCANKKSSCAFFFPYQCSYGWRFRIEVASDLNPQRFESHAISTEVCAKKVRLRIFCALLCFFFLSLCLCQRWWKPL